MSYTPTVTEINVQQAGGNAFPYPAGWVDTLVLTAGSAAAYDLTAARTAMGLHAGQPLFVIFSADGPFWANFHATASIPGSSTTDGTSSEFAPNQRYIDGSVTSISCIAAGAQKVSMQFFRP